MPRYCIPHGHKFASVEDLILSTGEGQKAYKHWESYDKENPHYELFLHWLVEVYLEDCKTYNLGSDTFKAAIYIKNEELGFLFPNVYQGYYHYFKKAPNYSETLLLLKETLLSRY